MSCKLHYIEDISDPRVAMFSRLTERELRGVGDDGLFIAESPKVIATALDAGYEAEALMCEERHLTGDAAHIVERMYGVDVFTGTRETLSQLTGYRLTRGVLCAMRRRPLPTAARVCLDSRRVCVIDGVCDTTNIGSIFRSAAALGIDAVLLTRDSCDPLNRRSIRVSMGSVFLVPWAWLDGDANSVRSFGMKTVALALRHDNIDIDSIILRHEQRLALIVGTEGDGLAQRVIDDADYVAKIPMHHSVDSLNVGAAAAVAFWALRT